MQKKSESIIILILFLVQFIDVLDFMVVMPLGPDFAAYLDIPGSKLGWIASSYTLAAAISGILTAKIIDRFERKSVMLFTLCGLVLANIFSANAWNLHSLLFSRFLAGAFGGPATSICFAVVADLFSEEKRGEVMGKVMSGFSFAAILGVPIGLEMALHFGWHASFYTVAFLGIIAIILITIKLPTITGHLAEAHKNKVTYLGLFKKLTYKLSFFAAFLGSTASFMIIPYVSPFIQYNMGLPRTDISFVYFVSGVGSFIAMRLFGKFVDRHTSTLTTMIANAFIGFSLIAGFVIVVEFIPVFIIFAPFMIGMAIRNVSNYTLFSKVPALHDRAGFMSALSCIQHLASSFGAIMASSIIVEYNQKLEYMDYTAIIAMILFMISPMILSKIERLRT